MIFIYRNLVYNFKSDSKSFLSLPVAVICNWYDLITEIIFDFWLVISSHYNLIHASSDSWCPYCQSWYFISPTVKTLFEILRFLWQSLSHNLLFTIIVLQFSFYKFRFNFMVKNLYELRIIMKIHYVLLNVLVLR